MSIAAKMYKAGCMPKARNKNREDKEVFDFKIESEREEKAADEEKEAGLKQQGPSASDKAASALWLKKRLNDKPRVNAPGTTNSHIASMTGSRYANQSGLPYKIPKNITSQEKEERKNVGFSPTSSVSKSDAKAEDSETMAEVPGDIAGSLRKWPVMLDQGTRVRFMRGGKFVSKPNRLVRQCIHCCLLYGMYSHNCLCNQDITQNHAVRFGEDEK